MLCRRTVWILGEQLALQSEERVWLREGAAEAASVVSKRPWWVALGDEAWKAGEKLPKAAWGASTCEIRCWRAADKWDGIKSQMRFPYLHRERTLGEGGLGRHHCPKTCSERNAEVWLHGTVDQTRVEE